VDFKQKSMMFTENSRNTELANRSLMKKSIYSCKETALTLIHDFISRGDLTVAIRRFD
jgi:hypothetical protein